MPQSSRAVSCRAGCSNEDLATSMGSEASQTMCACVRACVCVCYLSQVFVASKFDNRLKEFAERWEVDKYLSATGYLPSNVRPFFVALPKVQPYTAHLNLTPLCTTSFLCAQALTVHACRLPP
jgi:hypothetical protein